MIIVTKKCHRSFSMFCLIFILLSHKFGSRKAVLGVFYRYSHRMMKKQEKQRNLLFMQFLWNYAFFSFLSLTVKVWQRQSPGGNTRSHSEAAGKRWERGNFLTANARPWVWVLQCGVGVGSRCVSDSTFHKASFQVSRRLTKQKPPPLQGFQFCFSRDA